MNKDKKLIIFGYIIPSALTLLCGIVMLVSAFMIKNREESIQASVNTVAKEETTLGFHISEAEYFVIRENGEGKISVYLSDGRKYLDTDIRVFTQPKKDRELLSVGIMAESEEELSMLLEGFSG